MSCMNKTSTKEELRERVKTLKNDCSASHQAFLGILQDIRDVSFDPKLGPRLQYRIVEFINEWEAHCSVGSLLSAITRKELMVINTELYSHHMEIPLYRGDSREIRWRYRLPFNILPLICFHYNHHYAEFVALLSQLKLRILDQDTRGIVAKLKEVGAAPSSGELGTLIRVS